MVRVILKRKAEKALLKLPKREQDKIRKKLHDLAESPLIGKPLRGEYQGCYSLRAWPYRILYRFCDDIGVEVFSIAHRQGAYK